MTNRFFALARRVLGHAVWLTALLGASAGHAAPFAYSVESAPGPLSVIDAANPSIVARVPLGSFPERGLAVHPAGTFVYVARRDYVAVVDTTSRTVVATVPVAGASHLVMHPSGAFVYAASRINAPGVPITGGVAVIDTRTNTVIASLSLGQNAGLGGMAVHPAGTKVYVANVMAGCCEGSVSVLDTATNTITATIPLVVRGVVVADPAGTFVYAATSSGLSIIDAATNTVSATVAVSDTVADVGFDPARPLVYVLAFTSQFFGGRDGRVLVLDSRTHAVVSTISLDLIPKALALHPDGTRLYVAGDVPGSSARPTSLLPAGVAVVDTASRIQVATVPPLSAAPFTTSPGSVVVQPGGRAVYALDSSARYVIDTVTNRVTATLPPGTPVVFGPDTPPSPGSQVLYTVRSRDAGREGTGWGAPGDLPVPADYDGDGRADLAVFRPREGSEEGVWYVLRSSGGVVRQQWGAVSSGDVPVPADYDGDGRADIAVWRPAEGGWYILRSSDGQATALRFGRSPDVPVPADYDGDGRADLAVYAAGTWLVFGSAEGFSSRELGGATDVPVPGDYDGDRRADLAVWRPTTGEWLIVSSATGVVTSVLWGAPGDIPVPRDYDGDGKTDIAVWRPSTGAWFIINSSTGAVTGTGWGGPGDLPLPADYDGDRRPDLSVYRP